MKINKILIASVLAVALLGCGKHEPRHFVILPDVSGSIERESLEQAFKAIDELASHLQRGDRLTIIPILGDAEAEASGKILRFEVPTNRQAYDTDLGEFRAKFSSSLKEMETDAIVHPGAKTDIFGSVALSVQEFQTDTKPHKMLLVLSDFIQEDNDINFMKDNRFDDKTAAQTFAVKQAKGEKSNFNGIPVYLGLLNSRSYEACTRSRRSAIKEFWISYFAALNSKPGFASDGLNFLKNVLSE